MSARTVDDLSFRWRWNGGWGEAAVGTALSQLPVGRLPALCSPVSSVAAFPGPVERHCGTALPCTKLLSPKAPTPLAPPPASPLPPRSMSAIVHENPGIIIQLKRHQDLPACALDNDVMVEVGARLPARLPARPPAFPPQV